MDSPNKNKLDGEEIKRVRKWFKTGGQFELACELTVSIATISNWENTKTIPNRGNMKRLCAMWEEMIHVEQDGRFGLGCS